MTQFIDLFLHLDLYLNQAITFLGPWIYVLLFAVLFCETGLVITPFLPGDSLLFAIGALAALEGSSLNVFLLIILLVIAAILGDAVNYAIGRFWGPKIFRSSTSRFLNRKHLVATEEFYAKHGGVTIILARFMPIIRTFAPFVAGIGRMNYSRFALFNVTGGIVWVVSLVLAGYWFGNLPIVKDNFEKVVLGIVVVSFLPMIIRSLPLKKGG